MKGQTPLSAPATRPEVTVVIPVYDRADLVAEAVRSVAAQTHRDFELVLVDDGSTDRSAEAAAAAWEAEGRARGAAAAVFPQLRIRRIAHDGHPGAVRNRGAEWARGRYLAFLDADDLWRPQKLQRQLPLHREMGAAISHTREQWLRNGTEVSQKRMRHARTGWIFAYALVKCIIGPSTVVMSRELFEEVGGFREDLEIAEDYELWVRVTARHPVSYLDEPLTVKRGGHADQLSRKYDYIEPFRMAALRDFVQAGAFEPPRAPAGECTPPDPERAAPHETDRPPALLARAELARKCRIHAAGCEKRGKHREAEEHRQEAERLDAEIASAGAEPE